MNLVKTKLLTLVFISSATILQAEIFETEVKDTRSVAISDNDKLVAYGCYKKVYIIDAKTKQTVRVIEGAPSDVYELAFVGDHLIAAGDKYLGIWDSGSGKLVTLDQRQDRFLTFSVCKREKTVFIGGMFVEAFDIQTGKSVMKTDRFKNKTESFAVSPDGKRLFVSPEWGSSILVLDAKTGKQIEELTEVSRARQMLFHPDGKSLLINQFGKPVKQIDLKGKVLREIGVGGTFGQLALSNKGEYLLIPTWSTLREIEQVLVYDIKNGRMITPIDVSERPIYEAKITSDMNTVVVAPKDNLLHFIPFKKQTTQ